MNKEEIIKIYGLSPDATDDEIMTALKAGAKAIEDIAKKRTAEGEEEEKAAMSAAVKEAVAEAVKPIQEQVAALSASAVAHEKQDLIAAAAREGKVIALSADALAKISVADLQATIAKTAVTVPLNAQTPGKVKEPTAGGEPTEDQRMIALNCGVSPDIFKK